MNRYGLAIVVLLAPTLTVGCAKKPATITAPAPTGLSTVSPTMSRPEATPLNTSEMDTSRTETPTVSGNQPASTSNQRGGAAATGARPAPSEFAPVGDLVDIHFDFDKYAIRSRDAEILQANARWLRANPNALVLIEGHCDERGTDEYNLSLGDRRAKATIEYLVAQGVAAARMTTISYGKERPQCTEHNEACWSKNRRAHFLVKRG
jgi:peptidoglycan-associated lipoprotein